MPTFISWFRITTSIFFVPVISPVFDNRFICLFEIEVMSVGAMYPTERVNNFGVNVCLGVLSSAFNRISDILKKDVLHFMIRFYEPWCFKSLLRISFCRRRSYTYTCEFHLLVIVIRAQQIWCTEKQSKLDEVERQNCLF